MNEGTLAEVHRLQKIGILACMVQQARQAIPEGSDCEYAEDADSSDYGDTGHPRCYARDCGGEDGTGRWCKACLNRSEKQRERTRLARKLTRAIDAHLKMIGGGR